MIFHAANRGSGRGQVAKMLATSLDLQDERIRKHNERVRRFKQSPPANPYLRRVEELELIVEDDHLVEQQRALKSAVDGLEGKRRATVNGPHNSATLKV